jgi:ABC-2 type transport system permease protein
MGFRNLLRQLTLLPTYLKLSVLTMAENKSMLWGAIFSSVINLLAYVVFWNVITTQVPVLTGAGIAAWGRGELTVLMGMTEIAWGFGAFFWMGTWMIYHYVTEEGLEKFLIRPVSPFYMMLAESFWFGGLIQVAIGGVMVWFSCVSFGFTISLPGLLLGILALVTGQGALYALWAGLACLSFWIGRNHALLEVMDAIEIKFARMPIDTMPQTVQQLLTFILPVIYLATVPVMLLLGQLPLSTGLLYLGIAASLFFGWLLFFRFLFGRGLRRYNPVGG